MQKRWLYKHTPDQQLVEKLCDAINVSQPIASILIQRGITSYKDAKSFFRPSLEALHDPFLMKDMDKAVKLLSDALQKKEKIMVYGDYDVDGTTSVALVYSYLSKLTSNILYYIPDRYAEGYGVSDLGIQKAIDENVSLIITLDCGIKAERTIQKAHDAGIKTIICDHHLPGSKLPTADAVLDPKRQDCDYPYKELSGCGVGFKLLTGYSNKHNPNYSPFDYIDFLAVSIAADIVPITEENRIFAYYGLKKLCENPQPGLQALLDISSRKRSPDIQDIVFGIAPRINAAGRIKHGSMAVDLLVAKNSDDAEKMAEKINLKNDDRKKVDAAITTEALAMIEENSKKQLMRSTVLFKNDWHKGVIGIVASRCIEKFHKPTVILTEHNNKATGSARSIPGFDLYKAIEHCGDLLEQFGGHTHAAGLTLSIDKVPQFQEKFEAFVSQNIRDEQLVPPMEIDISLNFDKITKNFFNVLMQMEPFGPENLSPVFAANKIRALAVKRINDKHLKFTATQEGNSKKFEAIAYNMIDKLDMIKSGMPFEMAFALELNDYRGLKSIQLVVKDIKQGNLKNETSSRELSQKV